MSNWTELRRAARADVHEAFCVEARYFSAPNVGRGTSISVRVHNRIAEVGALTNEFADRLEEIERVILKRSDVVEYGIVKGGIVKVIETGVSYRLGLKYPPRDDFSVTFELKRLG